MQKFKNCPKWVNMPGRASFFVILLKSLSLMKRHLWGFSSRQIRIRHDNWNGTIFSAPSPISAQLSFLPNRMNSIKWPKKCPRLWNHTIFYPSMCASRHLNVLYGKSLPTILLYERWNMFQTFLLANFLSSSAGTLI